KGDRDDVLGRMLSLQRDPAYASWLDDDAIFRNISGLIIGAVDTTNKAAVHVIDELLRRPEALRGAVAAAMANDDRAMLGYTLEALRFNPFVPLLVRHAKRETTIGSDARKVAAG